MGYTHYWKHPQASAKAFEAFTAQVHAILDKCEHLKLRYEYDEKGSEPLVSEDAVQFNGPGEDGHETFIITKAGTGGRELDYCKTERKPYDAAVVACLLAAVDTLPRFKVWTDGTWDDWEEGRELYQAAMKREPPRPKDLE